MGWLRSAVFHGAVAAGAAAGGRGAGFVSAGVEGLHGEIDAAKDVAGALRAADRAGLRAALGGDAVVEGRDEQLGLPLQADDGELADGHKQTAALAGEHQLIIKPAQDALGQLRKLRTRARAGAAVHHAGGQNHGIHHLHH